MLLPIDMSNLRFFLMGEPIPVVDFESKLPRTDTAGHPLLKVPVIIMGTAEKRAPSAEVTVPGPVPELPQGSAVSFDGLTVRSWSLRGSDGRERSGVSLRAEGMAQA